MAGFTTKEDKKRLNKMRTSSKTIKGVVLGDALIMLGRAVRQLDFPVEEVEMEKMGMVGPMLVPFMHYSTSDGVDIPYGAYKLDGFGLITPSMTDEDSESPIPELTICVNFEKAADEAVWERLITLIEAEKSTYVSLFKGHALRIGSPMDMILPHIIDVTSSHDLFLNPEVEEEIRNNVIFPITNSADVQAVGIKSQRAALLHGKYGTGKSLIAYWAAQESVKVGRTFVLCRMDMLAVAVPVSRFLQPSTLFIEDMDMLGGGSRGLSIIRNMLSGVENKKGYDTMTILTTNFLDKVIQMDRSLLRPERVDAIIEVTPPRADVIQRLVDFNTKGWERGKDEDWTLAYQVMEKEGATPAIIIEVLNRAKIAAMRKDRVLTLNSLEKEYISMERQINLSKPVEPNPETVPVQLANALRKVNTGMYQS